MKESDIEHHLVDLVRAQGGFTRKVTYQGRKGAPDRWCFFPEGQLLMLELKRPGEKPDPLQFIEMRILRAAGQFVAWASSKEEVRQVLGDFHLCALPVFNHRWSLDND